MKQTWEEVKNKKGFKLCHINIRSLLPKFDIFVHEFLDNKLDVVGVSETWFHDIVNDNLILSPGYNLVRNDRASGKRGGGLCFYVKDNLVFQSLEGLNEEDGELLSIIVEKEFQKNILIVLVYRPPSGNVVKFLESLKEYLKQVYVEEKWICC